MGREPVRQDIDAKLWTLDQAALHVGFTRASVERYIREGLPKYFGRFVKPKEFMAEYVKRRKGHRASRFKSPRA